jgi:hypothetical protein
MECLALIHGIRTLEFEPAFRAWKRGIADRPDLAVNLHLVRNDRSLGVAFRFDLGNREAPIP